MTAPQSRKVFIVEDDMDFASYLVELVGQMGIETETFQTAEEFLTRITPEDRGCIIADIRLPGMTGLSMLNEARAKGITIPSIVLSGYATVRKAVSAMQDGALTLIEKPLDESDFWEAIHGALAEEERLFQLRQLETGFQECYGKLSAGEKDVYKRIIRGMPNKNIAFDLDVSLRTIESRRRKVFQKMKAHSVAELVARAISARHRIPLDVNDMAI